MECLDFMIEFENKRGKEEGCGVAPAAAVADIAAKSNVHTK